jgi:phytoene dehydrogenase-like protein
MTLSPPGTRCSSRAPRTPARARVPEVAGRTFRARRAVLASVTPAALYGHLLPEGAVDSALRTEAASFRHGRAALQIHVALSAPLSWCDKRLAEIPLIHLSDGSASTGIACAEAEAGLLPRRPTIVVGPTAALPSWTRAFYGAHSPRRACHATPVGRLWHIGASTHSGAGLGGVSGHLVATTLIRRKAW